MNERSEPRNENEAAARLATVTAMLVVTLAAVGLWTGMRATARQATAPRKSAAGPVAVGSARVPHYRDLDHFRRGPNAGLYDRAFSALAPTVPSAEGAPPMTEEARAERAKRRAYVGAPPTIPHAIDEQSAESCLVCHGTGARIAEKTAPVIPHQPYASCTQCHVPTAVTRPGGSP